MFFPRGFLPGELGDVEAVADGDALHLFYLVTPTCDSVGHAVSQDGLAWTELAPALRVGPPGSFDDDRIWTVSVTRHDGRWIMLYTALSRSENGRVQRVGVATSSDLMHWTKSEHNPVCAADARWYEATPGDDRWLSWRDPKPTRIGERYYATVCAKQAEGPLARRGVVALCSSEDLLHWQVEPPLFAPQQHCELECPQLFPIGQTYYLTAAVPDDRSQRYWMADDLRGPYRTPANNRVVPPGHYAARLCRWQNADTLLCWHQPLAASDGDNGRRVLSPLAVKRRADGTLYCAPWATWKSYAEKPIPLDAKSLAPQLSNNTAELRDSGVGVVEGLQLWDIATPPRDYLFSARFRDAAPVWGFGLAVQPDGAGWYIEIEPGAQRARLVRAVAQRDCNCLVYVREIRQEVVLPAPQADDRHLALRLVAGEIELTVDGQVLLSSWLDLPDKTSLALLAVSGTLDFTEATLSPMRRP